MTALLWAVYQSTNHQIAPAQATACGKIAKLLKPLTRKAEAERGKRQKEEMRRRQAEADRVRKIRETKATILADKEWMKRLLQDKDERERAEREAAEQKAAKEAEMNEERLLMEQIAQMEAEEAEAQVRILMLLIP
jgi:hypothetical protein